MDWLEKFGWGQTQLEELRAVAAAYLRQGKYEIAAKLFRTLTVLDPTNAYDAKALGALYVETDRPAEALPLLDRALKEDSRDVKTLMNLAKALFALGKVPEAVKIARGLTRANNASIASMAEALLLAYEPQK